MLTRKTKLRVGFVGLGSSVTGIVLKSLLRSGSEVLGSEVTVWADTIEELIKDDHNRCFKYDLQSSGKLFETEVMHNVEKKFLFEDDSKTWVFNTASDPSEVVLLSDIIFSCFSDFETHKKVLNQSKGLLSCKYTSKGYVEMTVLDAATSIGIAENIEKLHGKYLEVYCMSSVKFANERKLTLFSAGCKELYDRCCPYFKPMAEHIFYYGNRVGHAANMNLLHQFLVCSHVISLAETLSLCESIETNQRRKVNQRALIDLFGKLFSSLSPITVDKANAMIDKNYSPDTTVEYMRNSLLLLHQTLFALDSPCEIVTATYQGYMLTERRGHGYEDISAVYTNNRLS